MVPVIKKPKPMSDTELLEACKSEVCDFLMRKPVQPFTRKQLNIDACELTTGTSTAHKITTPPQNTIAAVVDIESTGGAFKIHKTSDKKPWGNTLVDMIGSDDDVENTTHLQIVPWEEGWWFIPIGEVSVKYIIKK
jgi:hypothetical protein